MGNNSAPGRQLRLGGKTVTVFPSEGADRPVVFLNTFSGEGEAVYKALRADGCPDFTLAAVSELNWDHDMSPWSIPPIAKDDTPCTGGADAFLRAFTDEIVPAVEAETAGTPLWRGLAGYSLAGLFALYSLYKTPLFSRVGSMSGSLWFPDFEDYVRAHEPLRLPTHVYFSLGDREGRTTNPYLKTVQERTARIETLFADRGVDTTFVSNPGNHYKNPVGRTAAGIRWLLER